MVFLLAFVAGDGAATAIQVTRGLPSPYLLMLPALGAALLFMVFDAGRVSFRLALTLAGLGAFSLLLLLLQLNYFSSLNLDGYIQLWVIVIALFAVQDLIADATDGLVEALRRAILFLHYGLAAYLVASALAWFLAGIDISVQALLVDVETSVNDYYGFRPAGLNREPAWAGFLLASTFIGVYFASPGHRVSALLGLVIGLAALRSGTAFAFAAVAVAAIVLQRQRDVPVGRSLLVAVVAAVVLISLFGARVTTVLQGADPSGLMRLDSAGVALDVIDRSFPVGVGYGNFREHADYGHHFASYIDLLSVPEYKSDIAILNLLAELGIAAIVLTGGLLVLYARGQHLLLWAHLAATLFLAGGLLIPSNVLVVAVIGLRERERRRAQVSPPVLSRAVTGMAPLRRRPVL